MPFTDVHPILMIVAGPAGTGKTTLAERIVTEVPGVEKVVTSTTRPARPGEVNGRDYHFFTEEEFDQRLSHAEFLESARVHGRYRYGTLRRSVQEKLAAGINLVMNVDVQGVRSIKEVAKSDPLIRPALVTVFVTPPDMNELRRRLEGRGADDDDEINRRLATATEEMRAVDIFDHVIVSASREEDFARLMEIWNRALRRIAGSSS